VTAGNPELFDDGEGSEGPEQDAPSPFFQLVAAAEEVLAGKIGRPRGARNRKSEAFEKWYFAKGYKDPAQFLGELVTADPIALGNAIGGATRLEVLNLQKAAAAELMPYLHGKKPIDVNVTGELLPTLIIAAGTNQLDQAQQIRDQRALSIGSPIVEAEANEINDLKGMG
jgi:hypothetical protein